MKPSDTFNFQRFWKYFKFDIRHCYNTCGLTLIAIPALILLTSYIIYVSFGMIFHEGWYWQAPQEVLRMVLFVFAAVASVITMPVKCYGNLTDKNQGSLWLMLPASRTEKYISMIITTTVLSPVISTAIFLGLDAIICLLDSTAGVPTIKGLSDIMTFFTNINYSDIIQDKYLEYGSIAEKLQQLTSIFYYIDDILIMILPFVLGAVYFKKGKVIKTFIAIAVFSIVMSIISTPIVIAAMNNFFNEIELLKDVAAQGAMIDNLLTNLIIIDSISDALLLIALLIAIFLRIKTLKH